MALPPSGAVQLECVDQWVAQLDAWASEWPSSNAWAIKKSLLVIIPHKKGDRVPTFS